MNDKSLFLRSFEEVRKQEKNLKKFRLPVYTMKGVDAVVIFKARSTIFNSIITGVGLIVIPIATSVSATVMFMKRIAASIFF